MLFSWHDEFAVIYSSKLSLGARTFSQYFLEKCFLALKHSRYKHKTLVQRDRAGCGLKSISEAYN